MNRISRGCLAVALLVTLLTRPVGAQDNRASGEAPRFVAKFRAETVDVTFYGTRPTAGQAEKALRNCLEAAAAIHSGSDIAGRAWHAKAPGDEDRQAVELTGGDGLLLVAAEGAIRFQSGGEMPSDGQDAAADGDTSWLTEDARVIEACKGAKPESVAVLTSAALDNRAKDRKLIVKAMRASCKEKNVALDRDLSTCMSAISKVVAAAKPDSAAPPPADLPAAIARGKTAYILGQCGKCHLTGGRGGERGPTLTDDRWIHCDGGISGIRRVLVSGVPQSKVSDPNLPFAMNPATNLISDDQQLTDLAIYVHSLSQN